MIKHIVLFNVKDGVDGRSKAQSIAKARQVVEAMNGNIPGLVKVEIGADFSATNTSFDMCLYSEFESRDALAQYAGHPLHQPVLSYLKSVISERRVIDYEI